MFEQYRHVCAGEDMRLIVNGDGYEYEGDATLVSLLMSLGADRARVAVVINDDVVCRSDYDTTSIKDGDRVEILTLAGGG